ncbi:hypothetical protein BDW59DRAFT_161462 [Aspergillus cavernicola]|uniref:Uncharacterized protein n=1 Tax=Aspergillus cavernicola TaxID=176166 RepID=A0ABR4IFV6_9EURO
MGQILQVGTTAGFIYEELNFTQLVNVWSADREGALDKLVGSREVEIDVQLDCKPQGILWGDVDNNGLDHFISIGFDPATRQWMLCDGAQRWTTSFTYLIPNKGVESLGLTAPRSPYTIQNPIA